MTIVPFKNSELTKKEQVEKMFDQISNRYDMLNHLLSVNIDKIWRKKAVRLLKKYKPKNILDVATGTADFAITAAKLNPTKIVGVDLSEGMLKIGRQKVISRGLDKIIEFKKADSENLPFKNNNFDAVTVGFGVRNFEDLQKGLEEIYRVLKKKGVLVVLEFSKPKNVFFSKLYFFYFKNVLPGIGNLISNNKSAYSYLPESVVNFPDGDSFIQILKKVGYVNCISKIQTCGIATIYIAQKNEM